MTLIPFFVFLTRLRMKEEGRYEFDFLIQKLSFSY